MAALYVAAGAAILLAMSLLWWPLPVAVIAVGAAVAIREIRRWPTNARPW